MNKRKLRNEELGRLSVERFRESQKTPLYIILDDIRSLLNIGSIFRTADCYRVAKIYLCGITARPPHRDIRKTALGATDSVEWEYHDDVVELVQELQGQGVKVASIEQAENSTLLHDFQPSAPQGLAIVLGNEVNGVSQAVVDLSDYVVELEHYGTKHSLNVAVCTGIVVYDVYNKLINPFSTQP
jgi:tRNA G18 (ribose-2'-O)-methylase SpoU